MVMAMPSSISVSYTHLVTGNGRFTDDFNLDGQVYAVMLRSPYPHARIVAIDAARAKAMPGCLLYTSRCV